MTHAPIAEAVDVRGTTRAAFLVRTVLGATGLAAGGALWAGAATVMAQEGGDEAVLALALTLEQVQVAFYERGIEVATGEAKELATDFLAHQRAHAEALGGLITDLGGSPAEARTRVRIADADAFLETAVVLEDASIQAYDGAAPLLESKTILEAAGAIAQVEARHAAAWRMLADLPPSPTAFEPALTAEAATKALRPFLAGS